MASDHLETKVCFPYKILNFHWSVIGLGRHLVNLKMKLHLSIGDVSKLSRADEDLYEIVNDNECWRKLFKRDYFKQYRLFDGIWLKNSDWKFSYLYHTKMVCFRGYTRILPREISYSKVNPNCAVCVAHRSADCCMFYDPLYFNKTQIPLRVGQVVIALSNVLGLKTHRIGKITKILPRAYSDEPFAELNELNLEDSKIIESGNCFQIPSKDPDYGTYIDDLIITNILLHTKCSHN